MGLDIYLRKCADLRAAKATEKEAEALAEKAWNDATGGGDYSSLTEVQKEAGRAAQKAVYARFGLDDYGASKGIEGVCLDSATDPEHIFKIGYLRSSYNEGGINRVLKNLGLLDLYGIFGHSDDKYEFVPDWSASLARCSETIAKYEAHLASDAGRFLVSELRPMHEYGVANEKAALDLFMGELDRHKGRDVDPDFSAYSNRDGEFFMGEPMRVRAVITKHYERPPAGNPILAMINRPTMFLVYEKSASAKPDWYLQALKITRETIEYVLAQPDKGQYYFGWSA
jgi:hypothetical protein